MDSVSIKGGMYRWFSGQGTPSAETADFRNAFVSDSDEALCEATDLIIAGRTDVLRGSLASLLTALCREHGAHCKWLGNSPSQLETISNRKLIPIFAILWFFR